MVSITALPQSRITLLANGEFTTATLYYKFAQHGQILRRGLLDELGTDDRIGLNYGAGLHFRATKRIALEIGYQKARMDLEVYDHRFMKANNIDKFNSDIPYRGAKGTDTNYDIAKLYNAAYFQVYCFANPDGNFQPYVSAGITMSFLDSKQPFASASYDYSLTNEHTTLTANFSKKYFSEFVEAGLSLGNGSRASRVTFFMGVNLHLADRVLSGDYSNTGGPVDYTDHVSASGTYLSLSARLGYTMGYIKDRNKSASQRSKKKLRSKPQKIRQNIRRTEPYRTP